MVGLDKLAFSASKISTFSFIQQIKYLQEMEAITRSDKGISPKVKFGICIQVGQATGHNIHHEGHRNISVQEKKHFVGGAKGDTKQ